jgi:hypothetical protein
MKPENEHIEVHEIRGFAADTLADALREAEAVSKGSRCRQFLYSLSLSPPETENVPVAVFENAVERIEEKLGLTGYPRVVVFHEKSGRRHAHCIWSRIDATTMRAVRMSHDRRKLTEISRQLYLEHRWKMPDGLIDPKLRNPLDFDRHEWFKAMRTGKDPRDIKAAFQQCWAASDSDKSFRRALEQRGYYLAKGDRRSVVALDIYGEVYAVSRWCGIREKEVAARFTDAAVLPSIQDVQKLVAELLHDRLGSFIESATEEFTRVARTLDGRRITMVEHHRSARRQREARQEARAIVEAKARAERFRKGILGLWDRITGKHSKLRAENECDVAATLARDVAEKQALVERQLRERQALQKEINDRRRRHARELARMHHALAEQRHQREETTAFDNQRQHRPRRRVRTFSP